MGCALQARIIIHLLLECRDECFSCTHHILFHDISTDEFYMTPFRQGRIKEFGVQKKCNNAMQECVAANNPPEGFFSCRSRSPVCVVLCFEACVE